jgi:hypothetical protein
MTLNKVFSDTKRSLMRGDASYRTLKLQIPPSPPFAKASVKVMSTQRARTPCSQAQLRAWGRHALLKPPPNAGNRVPACQKREIDVIFDRTWRYLATVGLAGP